MQGLRTSGADRVEFLTNWRGADVAPLGGMFINPAGYEPLTERILGGAIEIHRQIGPGVLEATYLRCLAH